MIDRKTYLEMCQAASVIIGAKGVRELPDSLIVVYNNHEYYPLSYSLSFDNNGKPIHMAVLHDLRANSVDGCNLHELCLKES